METTHQKIERFRAERADIVKTILARIEEVKRDKEIAVAEYDKELLQLHNDLQSFGVVTPAVGSTTNVGFAEQIYGFLSSYPGQWTSTSAINSRFKNNAALTVVLAEYLEDGRIEKDGNSHSYRVPIPLPPINNPRMFVGGNGHK